MQELKEEEETFMRFSVIQKITAASHEDETMSVQFFRNEIFYSQIINFFIEI